MDSNKPSRKEFSQQIRRKAKELERGTWLTKVGEIMLSIVISIPAGFASGKLWHDIAVGAISTAITTLTVLLAVIATRYWYFRREAYYVTHCEQLGRILTAEKEKEFAISHLQEKPLTLFEAKTYLTEFAEWLESQSMKGVSDIYVHKERCADFLKTLLNQDYEPDLVSQSISMGITTSIRPTLYSPHEILLNMAEDVRSFSRKATEGSFNESWRVPSWWDDIYPHPMIVNNS